MRELRLPVVRALAGIAAALMLSSTGASLFHLKWYNDAPPTELIGWIVLVFVAVFGMAHIALSELDGLNSDSRVRVLLGVGAGAVITAITPFPIMKYVVKVLQWGEGSMVFGLVMSISLFEAFVIATVLALYADELCDMS